MTLTHSFRFDINALRALAVISVLLFHFQDEILPGGFIGVDIFFVVSGFLMTSIILRGLFNQNTSSIGGGGFSLWRFYIMRARRIVPALLTVCILCLIWGFFNFSNDNYIRLIRHIRDSLLFTSNYTYLKDVNNYFSANADSAVLLHTWSLSAEWQFYIIYPLILILIKKLCRNLKSIKITIAGLFFSSLLCSVILAEYNAAADYFMLYGRAYEMLMGAFAYLYQNSSGKSRFLSPRILEVLGFVLILGSIFSFSQDQTWPGIWALIPTFGTMLILVANQQHAVYQLWLVQILGKISYSLYLVHWPVLAIAQINQIKLNFIEFSFLVLSIAGSLYFLIESKRKYKYKCLTIYILCLTTMFIVRHRPSWILTLKYEFPYSQILNEYDIYGGHKAFKYLDHKIAANENFSVLMFGDSYARQYVPLLNQYGVKTNQVILEGCISTLNYFTAPDDHEYRNKCEIQYRKFIDQLQQPNSKIIVWSQNWTDYIDPYYPTMQKIIDRDTLQPISRQKYIHDLSSQIQAVINELKPDQRLVLIAKAHRPSFDIYKCLVKQASRFVFNPPVCAAAEAVNSDEDMLKINRSLTEIVQRNPHRTAIFYPDTALCKDQVCTLIERNYPLYIDRGHLSILGADKAVPGLIKTIKSLPDFQKLQH